MIGSSAGAAKGDTPLLTAGLAFCVLGVIFLTVIMLGASIAARYDYAGGAISDLGVLPETARLFNLTLVSVGVLNMLGGYLFYRSHHSVPVLAMFLVGGLGAIGAGIFPLTLGNLHSLFALLGFAFFNLEALAAATQLPGPLKVMSAFCGVTGLVFVALMAIGDAGNAAAFGVIGHGGTERMIVYPVMLWLVILGGYLIAISAVPKDVAVGT